MEENSLSIFPGVYEGMPMEVYHNPEFGDSKSMLSKALVSLKHYWWDYVNPDRDHSAASDAMNLGTAFHTMILEPEKFEEEFVVGPDVKTRASKQWKAFVAENEGKTILTMPQMHVLKQMKESLNQNLTAQYLLTRGGKAEVSHFWKDSDTGLMLKCRPDFTTENGFVVDLKTTDCAEPSKFERTAMDLHYHLSAALTLRGMEATTGKRPNGYIFVVVERKAPFNVIAYGASKEFIELGEVLLDKVLPELAHAKKTDVWPGYADEIWLLDPPIWAVNKTQTLLQRA